jgi:hypothetical protein
VIDAIAVTEGERKGGKEAKAWRDSQLKQMRQHHQLFDRLERLHEWWQSRDKYTLAGAIASSSSAPPTLITSLSTSTSGGEESRATSSSSTSDNTNDIDGDLSPLID